MKKASYRGANVALVLIFVLFGAWIFWSIFGIKNGYSYWTDELFSVVASEQTLVQQFRIYLHDVHPPLYQLLLSGWIKGFGNHEQSTRSFSALILLFSLPAFVYASRRLGTRIAVLSCLLVLSNVWFVYYAQETRSYGLLLALSLWATVLFLASERKVIFYVLAALGATHFFGTLLAVVIIVGMIAGESRTVYGYQTVLATLAVAVTWPVIYLVAGNATNVIGGNFWINTSPAGAVYDALGAGLPTGVLSIERIASLVPLVGKKLLVIAAVLVCLYIFVTRLKRLDRHESFVAWKSFYLIVAMTLIVALISFHTPISTVRNFIVIVPASSFFVGTAFLAVMDRGTDSRFRFLSPLSLTCYTVLCLFHTRMVIQNKMAPVQDWRRVALEIGAIARSGQEVPVFSVVSSTNSDQEFVKKRREFYFSDSVDASLVTLAGLRSIPPNSIIHFGNQKPTQVGPQKCRNEIIDTLESQARSFHARFVEQSSRCTNGFIRIYE